jgi:MFS transporter, DHA3 family, multidrug efflux protein
VLGLSIVHLALVDIADRPEGAATAGAEPTQPETQANKVDMRGTLRLVHGVPGLLALIGFSCFNNSWAALYSD